MVIESHAWRERLGLRGGWTFVAEEAFIYNQYPMSWGNQGVLIEILFWAPFDPPREKEPLTTFHYIVYTTSMLLTERGIFGR